MSFWKNKRKENKLGQNSPFIPTPEYHAKAVRDKIYKGRAVPPPSRCFQKKKCDVFGDMARVHPFPLQPHYNTRAATTMQRVLSAESALDLAKC